jgi:hypothetical protein
MFPVGMEKESIRLPKIWMKRGMVIPWPIDPMIPRRIMNFSTVEVYRKRVKRETLCWVGSSLGFAVPFSRSFSLFVLVGWKERKRKRKEKRKRKRKRKERKVENEIEGEGESQVEEGGRQ